MKIVKDFPPNFELIKQALSQANEHCTYCYGDTIYRPDGAELRPDIIHHESIHTLQQGDNPDAWWYSYLTDPNFRREQEISAYGEQYLYAKKAIEDAADKASSQGKILSAGKNNLLRAGLESMATALSGPAYGNLMSFGEAVSKIRNYGKEKEKDEEGNRGMGTTARL